MLRPAIILPGRIESDVVQRLFLDSIHYIIQHGRVKSGDVRFGIFIS